MIENELIKFKSNLELAQDNGKLTTNYMLETVCNFLEKTEYDFRLNGIINSFGFNLFENETIIVKLCSNLIISKNANNYFIKKQIRSIIEHSAYHGYISPLVADQISIKYSGRSISAHPSIRAYDPAGMGHWNIAMCIIYIITSDLNLVCLCSDEYRMQSLVWHPIYDETTRNFSIKGYYLAPEMLLYTRQSIKSFLIQTRIRESRKYSVAAGILYRNLILGNVHAEGFCCKTKRRKILPNLEWKDFTINFGEYRSLEDLSTANGTYVTLKESKEKEVIYNNIKIISNDMLETFNNNFDFNTIYLNSIKEINETDIKDNESSDIINERSVKTQAIAKTVTDTKDQKINNAKLSWQSNAIKKSIESLESDENSYDLSSIMVTKRNSLIIERIKLLNLPSCSEKTIQRYFKNHYKLSSNR